MKRLIFVLSSGSISISRFRVPLNTLLTSTRDHYLAISTAQKMKWAYQHVATFYRT